MTCSVCREEIADGGDLCPNCSDLAFRTALEAETLVEPRQPQTQPGLFEDGRSLPVGYVICDRYEVKQMLGRGGMGCVYKVLDRQLDRVVALKTIRSEFANNAEMLRRFKREILLARQVTHKNVIRIFDFGTEKGLYFITMEFFEGEDLRSRLERTGKLAPAEAIGVACQICEGLACAHTENVVHRDLKPQNVLINTSNEIRILDFGLAHLFEGPGAASMVGVLAGTPDYMSPEQAKGEPLDARSDLYSFGLLLYEMLTGKLPFEGESVVARLLARTRERPRPLSLTHPETPLALSNIVSCCLELDRVRRYASASDILHELQEIAIAKPAGALRRMLLELRFERRVRRAVLLAAAICLSTIAVIALRHWAQAGNRNPPAATGSPDPYVAVLALKADNASAVSVAEGVRESLTSHLLSNKNLHTVAATAVDKLKTSTSGGETAQQLGANFLVEGEVKDQAGQVWIKLALYDARKDSLAWEHEVSGDRENLLHIENDLAASLLAALQVRPTGRPSSPPTHDIEAYDLYLQGRTSLNEKRNDAAESEKSLRLFEQAVSKDPSFALAWTGIADASLNLYRLKHAPVDAQRAVDAARRAAEGSDMPEVHLTAGSVYTQTGRPEEAIAEIRRALELQPNSDDAYVRLGRAYLEKGETNLAIQALKNAVRLNPYYWYNQEQLARAYFRIGKSDEALAAFRKTAELDPESASAHLGIAGVLVRQGKWEESIPEYKQSIALKPTATAYTSLGTVFFYLRRYREALPYFEKAAKLQNTVPLALANLGSAYRQTGQRDKANEIFGKAIAAAYARLRLNPSDALMLGEEALLHAYTGQTAQALSFIEKARAIDPSSNELMYDEAVVHALAGPSHLAEAIKALKSALDNGYSLDEARHDPDLQALQNQPEFQALLGRRSIK